MYSVLWWVIGTRQRKRLITGAVYVGYCMVLQKPVGCVNNYNYLIVGFGMWCAWFVNSEFNCKCNNVIATVLQAVRCILL